MRSYLFKAKVYDEENKTWRWESGGCLKEADSAYILARGTGEILPCDPDTICMCSLSPDRNGTMVWENDIVLYRYKSIEVYGIVRMAEYTSPCNDNGVHLGFYIEWQDKYLKNTLRKDLVYWLPDIEVKGNIIDNPELLEGNGENE